MSSCAFIHNRLPQKAIIQHRLNVLILNLLRDINVEFGVDMQRLGGTKLVLEDADASIEREFREKYSSACHGILRVGGCWDCSGFGGSVQTDRAPMNVVLMLWIMKIL